ncbi:DUF4303 domain-containing protein [Ruania alba]|uniref:DUF4303 domain-containing protein n=1 Tax=Ruania alba TaxID=648782 RepID=A0A1H5N5Z4_9MICO|nr:DUF4303 domain-containing protein [Ruania alba]SEE96890.1 protein of unknown function [Ruania alba]
MVASDPIPALVDAIAEATDEAIRRLRSEHRADFCVYALVTSGEAYRPYLTATVHGKSRWDLADSPYALVADEILARTDVEFTARGQLHDMDVPDAEEEYWRRLTSMEAALRRLDETGLFGTGVERARILLVVATMPPDESDAGFARRLNPAGPLLDAWLAEAAEGA